MISVAGVSSRTATLMNMNDAPQSEREAEQHREMAAVHTPL